MSKWNKVLGLGGIGTGIIFQMSEDLTLGRNESRLATLTDAKDYCKQHIILHYISVLAGDIVSVYPIGMVGDDAQGNYLIDKMVSVGMNTSNITKLKDSHTMFSVCLQYPDKSGCNITSENSACNFVSKDFCSEIVSKLADHQSIFVIAPEIPLETRMFALKQASELKAFTVFSASSVELDVLTDLDIYKQCNLVSINEDEAKALSGKEYQNINDLALKCAEKLCSVNPEIMLCITFGKNGCFSYYNGVYQFLKAIPPKVVENTGGAGDAFLGGVISGLILGLPFQAEGDHLSAVSLGSLVASLSVESPQSIADNVSWEIIKSRSKIKYR